jgi:hypothetical protein
VNNLDALAASNTAAAAALASDTNLNLDGAPTPTSQLPEAVILSQDAPESVALLKTLRAALWAVQDAGLDEFVSWALHADPANPNL